MRGRAAHPEGRHRKRCLRVAVRRRNGRRRAGRGRPPACKRLRRPAPVRVGALGRAETRGLLVEATPETLGDLDLCFFSVGSRRAGSSCRTPCAEAQSASTSRPPSASQDGIRARCVPEVNGERAPDSTTAIVANPNCCAIPLTLVLKPLHDAAGTPVGAGRDLPVGVGRGRAAAAAPPRRAAGRHDLAVELELRRREFDEETKLREERARSSSSRSCR